jgi:4-amino-4-deoxychorismate lyase
MKFWYGGQLFETDIQSVNPLPLDSEGLRFGASVFTTLRVYSADLHHPMTQWQAHCDRLAHSVQAFGWSAPDWDAVYQGCSQLKADYPVLRITLFADGREWITGRSLPELAQQQGVACWVAPSDYARSLPLHKTGNYLACWLARQQAQRHGAQEAILTSAQGDWLETTTGNLWGWAEGQWWTPVDNCLPGLMRQRLQQILTAAQQPVRFDPWIAEQARRFEAVAYSNCVVELLPIHTITNGATTLKYDSNHPSIKALKRLLAHAE